MNAIALELRQVLAESREHVPHDGHAARPRDVGEESVERARVSGSVIGRHLHADDQHLRPRALRRRNHGVEILARRLQISAAQRVIAAELEDDDRRPMLAQQPGQARAAARRRVA